MQEWRLPAPSRCIDILSFVRTERRSLAGSNVGSLNWLSVFAAWCWLCSSASSSGMTVTEADVPQGSPPALLLRGEIVVGDFDRLAEALDIVGSRRGLASLDVDSPGGNILEADRLATLIRRQGYAVSVAENEECASACFLLFAASRHRAAAPGARIGVHSASMFGDENLLTLDVTAFMAREAATFGVPPSVLGRMITTVPSDMAWLTDDELRQMGVAREDTPKLVQAPEREPVVVETPSARRDEAGAATTIVQEPDGTPSLAGPFSYRAGDARGPDIPTATTLNQRPTTMSTTGMTDPAKPVYVPTGSATGPMPLYTPAP